MLNSKYHINLINNIPLIQQISEGQLNLLKPLYSPLYPLSFLNPIYGANIQNFYIIPLNVQPFKPTVHSKLISSKYTNDFDNLLFYFSFFMLFFISVSILQTYNLRDRMFRLLLLIEILILSMIILFITTTSINLNIAITHSLILLSLAACETALGLALLIVQRKTKNII